MAITPLGFQVGPDRITARVNPYLDSAADIDRAIEECPMRAISLLDGSD